MRIIRLIQKYGIIGSFRKGLQKFLQLETLEKQQEAIDSIYFYINNYLIEATSLPPTKDQDLRIMQKCDTELLRILDKICQKHHLTYWLDFGTLLGARRHQGFIPWDDDMDVSMMRDDYNKLIPILKTELSNDDFDIGESNGRIGFGYKHDKTGIWCDVFPVDTYPAHGDFEASVTNLKDKIKKYRIFYEKNKAKISSTQMQIKRKEIIDETNNKEEKIVYHGREFDHQHPKAFYLTEDIFPLSTIEFEGYTFPAPNKVDFYLTKIYSKSYMQLPKSGILHHGKTRGALSTWAKSHNINMETILNFLSHI